jgi:spermidine/putrescine transport system permease protein
MSMAGKVHRPWFSTLVFLGVLLFLYLPLGVLVVNSFNASKYGGRWDGFTLGWYEKLRKDEATLAALGNTLKIAALATGVSTLLGTLAAWCLHRYRSRLQSLHLLVTELPLAVPDIWIGVALQLFFIQAGWDLGFGTVLAAHVTFCLCYVTALMVGRLQGFDMQLVDAARDLGAGPVQVALRIVLPVLLPGMIAAGLMAFILSVDDFVITFFVSGPGGATLPAKVYAMARTSRNMPVINALSTILILATLLTALLGQRFLKPKSE